MRIPRLNPAWLAEDGREHMGLELDCPRHAGERCQIWFENPCDGGAPRKCGRTYHLASECEFDELTVLPSGPAPYQPIQIGHWRGWLIEGELQEALITGVAW